MIITCARVANVPTPPEEVIAKYGMPARGLCATCLHEVWVAHRSQKLMERYPDSELCCNDCLVKREDLARMLYMGETPDVETSH